MIKPFKNDKLAEFLSVLKYMIWGFLLALVLVGALFMKIHWAGFMKFVNDPYFFDNLAISRDYQLKK